MEKINWIWSHRSFLLFFVLTLAFAEVPHGQDLTGEEGESAETFTAYLEERIPQLMHRFDIPGVTIGLVEKGETVWTAAFGYADLKTESRMSTDTWFRVESISKSVTAWGVMKLVEEGVLDLDRPVADYIDSWEFPSSKFDVEKVTVRRLLSQTSGMPLGNVFRRYAPDGDVPTLRESLSDEAYLGQEPGISFIYSNTGYNLLELLIEEVTGRDFAEYMETEVLLPLGMKHASFKWNDEISASIARGYTLKGETVSDHVYPGKASGGLFSTIEDIAAFVAAGMISPENNSNRILKPDMIQNLYRPVSGRPGIYGLVFDAYGFGYFIEELPNGLTAVSHGGQGYGWMSHFHSVPEKGDGIVILTNSQRSWPFFGYLLRDWTRWKNYPGVGMEMIIAGTRILWGVIGILLLLSLWLALQLVRGFLNGNLTFDFWFPNWQLLRIIQLMWSLILLGVLAWSWNQDYLFLNSVFPSASGWLGIAVFIVALVLLLTALTDIKLKENKEKNFQATHNEK